MKLEPDCVVAEPTARQPHSFDRRLALLDPLFRRAAPVVERHDALGGTPQVGDDEADAGIEFARMPIDLGNNARSEEHTSELQSLMRLSYAVFGLKKKKK